MDILTQREVLDIALTCMQAVFRYRQYKSADILYAPHACLLCDTGVPRVFTDRPLPAGLQPGEVDQRYEPYVAYARTSRINISVRAVS